MADENSEREDAGAVDLSGLGAFDFTPSWAKGAPGDAAQKYSRFEPREERDERRGGERRGERRSGTGRPTNGGREGARRSGTGRPTNGGHHPTPARREFVKPLEAEIRILPDQKELGGLFRRIQGTHLAYPLRQIERLFLDNPGACLLRITPRAEAAVSFRQCKACGAVAFSDEELRAHLVSAHLGDYYDAEEIDCEPPKGAFPCVAKCGLTGELLGPPNLHGYDACIRERVRTRFPTMSEDAYRARIVMSRDADEIEAWRNAAVKKTVYRKKGAAAGADAEGAAPADGAAAVERAAAERAFLHEIAPSLMSAPKAVVVTAEAALKASDPSFVRACRFALEDEKRRPRNLSFALHGAFRHRKLEFFRANDPRGPEFVTAVKPSPLDTEHAIPALADIVRYVGEHPCVTLADLVAALAGDDRTKASDVKAHVTWLVEKGHLVGFADGRLSAPDKHPVYRRGSAPAAPAAEPVPSGRAVCPQAAEPVPSGRAACPQAAEPVPFGRAACPQAAEEEPLKNEPQEEKKSDETADQLAE